MDRRGSRRRAARVGVALLLPNLLLAVAAAGSAQKPKATSLGAPTSVTAVSKERTALVQWVSGPGAVGYRVQRSDRAYGGFVDVPGTPTTELRYIDRDVVVGATYYYRVSSIGAGNREAAASAVSVTITGDADATGGVAAPLSGNLQVIGDGTRTGTLQPMQAGPAPTNVAAKALAGGSVGISGVVAADASAYSIARSIRGGPWTEVGTHSKQVGVATAVSAVDGPLAPNLDVAYRVTARYPDNRVGTSDPASTRTLDEHPAGFAARLAAPGIVEFSWQAMPGAARYEITGSGGNWTTSATSHRASGVPAGRHWWVLVAHFDLPGGGSWTTNDATARRVALEVQSSSGRYRVTLNGLSVLRASTDDALQLDGKGDEVFIAVHVQPIGAGRGTWEGRAVRTQTMGDVNGYPTRVRLGSAGTTGGLITGDRYPSVPWQRSTALNTDRLPLIVWEGELKDGQEGVVVTPTVWEWDREGEDAYGRWINEHQLALRRLQAAEGTGQVSMTTYLGWRSVEPFPMVGLLRITECTSQYCDQGPESLPVGMQLGSTPGFKPHSVVLTFPGAEAALNQSSTIGGLPAGIVQVTYDSTEHGRYTLFLQIERIP